MPLPHNRSHPWRSKFRTPWSHPIVPLLESENWRDEPPQIFSTAWIVCLRPLFVNVNQSLTDWTAPMGVISNGAWIAALLCRSLLCVFSPKLMWRDVIWMKEWPFTVSPIWLFINYSFLRYKVRTLRKLRSTMRKNDLHDAIHWRFENQEANHHKRRTKVQ